MTNPLLQVQDLKITLSGNNVIKDMNFDIQENALTTFLGPSGSGKTTVLRAIAGLNRQISGKIILDGKEIQSVPVNKRDIGMIFQSYALFPNLSVFDNVAYGLQIRKESKETIQSKVSKMLAIVSLSDKSDAFPANLSGGQKQRVAIARAMVLEPKLLLLDEPLSALDAKIRVELRTQIRQYQQELGVTMLFVTHDQSEAMAISDDIIVMDQGRVQQQGTPMDIYTTPKNKFIAQFIGNHNLLSGNAMLTLGFRTAKHEPIDTTASYIIRPELFALKPTENSVKLSGRISSMTILGDRIRYTFKTTKGIELKVETLNQDHPFERNTTFTMYLNPDELGKVGD
ncbi:spermidine/putrescine import ATP-binding protein PotA [Lentilactobacillus sunkii]|uniref:ABC-type quaternary amine transporter n=1 Tax=Lentilactobacillus sunkii TaxID=481719 RepID=A0A1E7XJ12_9LACO|nr:ABC transporter ATP-binding protein [Lentilactobacillus sunkii]OFA13077.1 spermidine/putrescine import ATP-binding protein PotA [Lentilactobacillus sunkii]